jgi:hypothetical protein
LRASLSGARARVAEPDELVWTIFVELSRTRTYSGAGPNPITFAEIEASCRLMRWPLEPHHIGLIRALDSEWMRVQQSGSMPLRSSAHGMTVAAFDAMFE